ncbi:LptF/LptG family permease [Thermovibrio ammonificans]|uniref:Permease YjgP/YjgQ family protein n=1 Tax=Thermovibrio ammonificans (strain DSM 15698 / JCM 12110 / HB-1) TaxID=648996 RepID=E8T6K0_THEA1|nr:LptF/LptG family permease [Thermovibrio ammonificans]ADU96784.1 permease YjgP/YjgQ family protein [Thermovibrio ammonificans HB-1]
MIKKLDRYVFSEGVKFFFLTLTTFLTLFAVIDFVSHFNMVSKVGASGAAAYILGRLPLYGVRVIPIATLIATMVTLSRFSETSELTVARALGISTYRFSAPLVILGVLASVASVAVQETLLPAGLKRATEIALKAGEEVTNGPQKVPGVWFKDRAGDFVFFWELLPKNKRAERVSIIKVKDFSPTGRIDAEEAIYKGGGRWLLREVFVRDFKELKSTEKETLPINLGVSVKELLLSVNNPEAMGLLELFLTIKRLSKLNYDTNYLRVELYSKLALGLLPVITAIIGIPFGVYNPRNKKGYTVLLAAIIVVSMWITVSLFLSLGKSEVLPPLYAAFAPLLLFGAVGLFLLGRVES